MSNTFRYDDCQVTQVPGGFRVREMRSRKDFFVRLEICFRKSAPGRCSCGSPAAEVPVFQCRHQRAVSALLYQRHLSRLARSGLFSHPQRLTLKFERDQRRVLRAFSRASRAGPPPCPHCGQAITAQDWERGQRRRAAVASQTGALGRHFKCPGAPQRRIDG